MKSRDAVDVLIAGGGPAGLAAAVVLAQQGLRVVVCERKRAPVNKLCGEGLMPTGVGHLRQLGVAGHLAAADYYPFAGIRYHSPQGRTAAANFAEGPGWGINRCHLADALLKRAGEFEQIEIRERTPINVLARHNGRIVVQAGEHQIVPRLLIGADGLNSTVRRWAGLEGRPWLKRWGAGQHFQVTPWSDYVEVYWGNGLEAYVTPCGRGQVGVVFLWDKERYSNIQGGRALFASLLQAFPHLQAQLGQATPVDEIRAIGPLHRVATSPIADGLLLLGDAAGYLDAITGEGLSLALAQAISLEQTVAPLLQKRANNQGITARDLLPYAQSYQAIVRPYYQLTGLVLRLSQRPYLVEWVIRLLGKKPALFQYLLSANMGLVSPWSLPVLRRAWTKS